MDESDVGKSANCVANTHSAYCGVNELMVAKQASDHVLMDLDTRMGRLYCTLQM